MKTVYIVHRWMLHEDTEICAVFEKREDAHSFCVENKHNSVGYWYDYEAWEVK